MQRENGLEPPPALIEKVSRLIAESDLAQVADCLGLLPETVVQLTTGGTLPAGFVYHTEKSIAQWIFRKDRHASAP